MQRKGHPSRMFISLSMNCTRVLNKKNRILQLHRRSLSRWNHANRLQSISKSSSNCGILSCSMNHEFTFRTSPALLGALCILGSISIASDLEGKDLNGFFAQCKSMDKLIKHSFIVAEALDEVYDISDEIIGEGGYCVVRKGVDKKTGELVAIKELSKHETSSRDFWLEVDVLRTAGEHPNIMRLRGVYEDANSWYIVQELASDGELFDHLIENGAYSERQASYSIRELCDALHYLHRKGIVHGDIKPENVLLHENRMCLVDFGVSFRLGERFGDDPLSGTVAYSAPEILMDDPASCKLGPEADMFALGIVLYILLCGTHPFDPFNNLTDDEIRQRIIKGKFRQKCRAWYTISAQARDLIVKLLESDPKKRLTSHDALHHPWLAKNDTLSTFPMPQSAESLEKFQRGRRRLRASILAVLLDAASVSSSSLLTTNLSTKDDDEPVVEDGGSIDDRKDLAWGISSKSDGVAEKKADAFVKILQIFDREGKGFISSQDLKRVVEMLGKKMSDAEINEMIAGTTGDPEQKTTDQIGYEDIKLAISTLRSASFSPGEIIIREGNPSQMVYLLLDGEVEVSCKNPIAFYEKTNKTPTFPLRTKSNSIILKRLKPGNFFGEVELMAPNGEKHPRMATYRCTSSSSSSDTDMDMDTDTDTGSCKVLELVANDFLNVRRVYEKMNQQFHGTARQHTQEQLIKCVEAVKGKGSIKHLEFKAGEFVYQENEACDSFFIITEGKVEVLQRGGDIVVEQLHAGDYFPLGVSGYTQNCKILTRHSSVRCKTATKVIEINGEIFRSFLSSHQFTRAFFQQEIQTREKKRLEKSKKLKIVN